MKRLLLFSLIFFSSILGGCATSPVVDEAAKQGLMNSKVALTLYAPSKDIIYQETLYRVLWLEYKDDTVSYEGLWEIEKDLFPLYDKGFNSMGIRTDVYSSDVLTSYQKALKSRFMNAPREGANELTKKHLGPTLDFYKSLTSLSEFNTLSEELVNSGYKYLIEVYVLSLSGNAPGYGLVIVGSNTVVNIIDLEKKSVIVTTRSGTGENYQLGGDLNKLEEDNLKILKEGINLGTTRMFEKGVLKTALGL